MSASCHPASRPHPGGTPRPGRSRQFLLLHPAAPGRHLGTICTDTPLPTHNRHRGKGGVGWGGTPSRRRNPTALITFDGQNSTFTGLFMCLFVYSDDGCCDGKLQCHWSVVFKNRRDFTTQKPIAGGAGQALSRRHNSKAEPKSVPPYPKRPLVRGLESTRVQGKHGPNRPQMTAPARSRCEANSRCAVAPPQRASPSGSRELRARVRRTHKLHRLRAVSQTASLLIAPF